MPAVAPPSLLVNLDAIEDALRAALQDGPSELLSVSRYVMGWEDADGQPAETGGKRIRPALCLFAATLFGKPASVAMPGAVAVELIHNFSLVHDEVQDHDAERHHRPTVWARMGEAQAINVGDFLITKAFEALAAAPNSAEQRLRAIEALNAAMAAMIAGQWADVSFETRTDVSSEEYLAMVRGKTGALLGAPLAIGAILAGASPEQAAALQEWGETVGLAFQVQDDYLGIWGQPNLTGKSNTNDIVRRKQTLPIIHGMAGEARAEILAAYGQELIDNEAVGRVVTALERVGADRATKAGGERIAKMADDLLAGFELPAEIRRELHAVGRYLIDRDR